jgi:hypothetical protein
MDKDTLNGLVVVYKKGAKFFTGGIKNGKVVRYRPVKKLTDLKRRDEYVTLAAYLKGQGEKTKAEVVLAGLRVDGLYILQPVSKGAVAQLEKFESVGQMSEKAWTRSWWSEYYGLCVKCEKTCKQSSMILGLYCPSYIKLNS